MAKDSSGIVKFTIKTNKSNRFGKGQSQVKYGKKELLPPYRKHKMATKNIISTSAMAFKHKKIQTPIPTPISVQTGDRVEKSRSTKQLEKIQADCSNNNGKTTMKAL